MDPNPAHATEDLWVFAYGSLMWRPDFPFAERIEARLVGAHRALCVYSFVHRGTPERPGLVLGLDRGGTCRGIAYRVAAAECARTIAYLRAREQVTSVYRECTRPIWLKREPEQRVPALCYMVDRGHGQYAGRLTLRSEEHTSELQSPYDLVCRLLLEKKKTNNNLIIQKKKKKKKNKIQ